MNHNSERIDETLQSKITKYKFKKKIEVRAGKPVD